MNSRILNASVLLATLLVVGCKPKTAEVMAIAETVIVGPEYSASKGIYVPEDTRRSLGLKVVEIGEEKITTTINLSLRVYESGRDSLRASATVAADEARALKLGQALHVTTTDGQTAAATIRALSDQMKDITGNVEVLVEIKPTTSISVGSFVTAELTTEGSEVVATVPRSALVQAIDGYFVYAASGEHFVRTPVIVGALTAKMAEIKEGLYSGDQVVSEPAMSLWLTELAAVKGGHACCAVPAKGK
jgi:hypothetical protein